MSKRFGFPAVTLVLVVVTSFALLEKYVGVYATSDATNGLSQETFPYLQAAANQDIPWQPLSEKVFEESNREQRPIFMMIGIQYSLAARRMDKDIFTDETVSRLLASNFICVRVDLDETPGWKSAFLPVSRVEKDVDPACQAWVLDPNGKLISPVAPANLGSVTNASKMADELIAALDQYRSEIASILSGRPIAQPIGSIQKADLDELNSSSANFNLLETATSFGSMVGPQQYGGFPKDGVQTVFPNAIDFVDQAVGAEQAELVVKTMLQSPIADVVDGLVFRGTASIDWIYPDFDAPASFEAELACALARYYAVTHEQIYLGWVRRIASELFGEYLNDSSLVRASRIGDESEILYRSYRCSFPPPRLRTVFPKYADRSWVWNTFGLRVETNPAMIPFIGNLNTFEDFPDRVAAAIALMREAEPPAIFDRTARMDVNGTVAARMIDAGRLCGDQSIVDEATSLYERLFVFRNGNDVGHVIRTSSRATPSLCDYLAYSDACLSDFENLGRIDSLTTGMKILKRAHDVFKIPGGGLGQVAPDSLRDRFSGSNPPELADDFYESDAARLIRLDASYGQLLANSATPGIKELAAKWQAEAIMLTARYTVPESRLGPYSGGFNKAAAFVEVGRTCVSVGSNPSEMASQLQALGPVGLVAPAVGPVWPSLQTSAAGYYFVVGNSTMGPYSLNDAFRQMGTHYLPQ